MTTAVCKACGELKFGAWLPCGKCGKTTNSLWLSDHYLSEHGLKVASQAIKEGQTVSISKCLPFLSAKARTMILLSPIALVLLAINEFVAKH
ncbi:hypothetical protein [Paraburkholderia fungorum]|uniref:hypothetical protein n=1 Tax=Paraburkholderia fungorum TaxID=134537 RepID=UPI001619F89E|nr:hypothetical protein [Paraburkholderia fungorum]MBB5547388.1 hypothetical protein [Paraburkholderia fungorum]